MTTKFSWNKKAGLSSIVFHVAVEIWVAGQTDQRTEGREDNNGRAGRHT